MRTNYKDDWRPDWWRDRQEGGMNTSQWGESDSNLGVRNLRVDEIYTRLAKIIFVFGLRRWTLEHWSCTLPSGRRWDGGRLWHLFRNCSSNDEEEDVMFCTQTWMDWWLMVCHCCSGGLCWFRVVRLLLYGTLNGIIVVLTLYFACLWFISPPKSKNIFFSCRGCSILPSLQ